MIPNRITLQFFVSGKPAPGGSKKFMGFNKKTGRALIVDDAKGNKNWRSIVEFTARRALGRLTAVEQRLYPLPRDVAAFVEFEFAVARPKSHYNSKHQLKPNAPLYPLKKPDALKLARSTEDALTGIVWEDDASTAKLTTSKIYATSPEAEGCMIYMMFYARG